MEKILDVAIVGAGWSGIVACKHMKQNNLDCLLFESNNDIGGVWKYREDSIDVGGVMYSTRTTSSRCITEMSDFLMPEHFSHFPSHKEIWSYLNDYIDHFNFRDQIITNCKITNIKKSEGFWHLTDENGNKYKSKNIILTTGVHQFPNKFFMEDEKFCNSKIKMMHACEYKKLTPEFFDKKILIYGSGETASDIAAEITSIASSVSVSVPHGQWIVSRFSPVNFTNYHNEDRHLVLDMFSSRLRRLCDPMIDAAFAEYMINQWRGKCGHNIKEWESPAPYWGQFFNKNADILLHHIDLGAVKPKGDISKVKDNLVMFADGTEETFDIIIFCSGYKTSFPFLNEGNYNIPINDHFKFMFNNDDPSLAFIGFARPIVGSIPGLAEMQSMYASKVFSNKITLPNKKVRDFIIEKDKKSQLLMYGKTSMRISGLVHHFKYSDELAVESEIYPNYFKLFLKNPKKWFYAVIAPHHNCQYLLNDDKYHDHIFKTFEMYRHQLVRIEKYINVLIVNIFKKSFLNSNNFFKFLGKIQLGLLWIIFSPFILARIIFNPERMAWKNNLMSHKELKDE